MYCHQWVLLGPPFLAENKIQTISLVEQAPKQWFCPAPRLMLDDVFVHTINGPIQSCGFSPWARNDIGWLYLIIYYIILIRQLLEKFITGLKGSNLQHIQQLIYFILNHKYHCRKFIHQFLRTPQTCWRQYVNLGRRFQIPQYIFPCAKTGWRRNVTTCDACFVSLLLPQIGGTVCFQIFLEHVGNSHLQSLTYIMYLIATT